MAGERPDVHVDEIIPSDGDVLTSSLPEELPQLLPVTGGPVTLWVLARSLGWVSEGRSKLSKLTYRRTRIIRP